MYPVKLRNICSSLFRFQGFYVSESLNVMGLQIVYKKIQRLP